MKKIVHKANTRGYFDYGWLKTNHTFSFSSYYNPDRVRFGLLGVVNDDIVAPGKGFGTHAHNDMEIVSIPLKGTLAHKDSAGNEEVIVPNDVQVMSAGTGITHSEYNHSANDEVNFLQLWIFPDKKGYEPRYDQKSFNTEERKNQLLKIVSPDKNNDSLWLNQDAHLSMSDIEKNKTIIYKLNTKENGVYVFLIDGEISVGEEVLHGRDGMGIWEIDDISLTASKNSQVLLIEVPMN